MASLLGTAERARDAVQSLLNERTSSLKPSGTLTAANVIDEQWAKLLHQSLYTLRGLPADIKRQGERSRRPSRRGPRTDGGERVALAIAMAYHEALGKKPTHSSRDAQNRPRTPFDRVCDAVREYLRAQPTVAVSTIRLSDGARRTAVATLARTMGENFSASE